MKHPWDRTGIQTKKTHVQVYGIQLPSMDYMEDIVILGYLREIPTSIRCNPFAGLS